MIQPAAAPDAKRVERQRREGVHRPAERDQHARKRAHQRDHPIFAEPVADRSDNELNRAVTEGIGRDHDRCLTDRGSEIGRNLGQ